MISNSKAIYCCVCGRQITGRSGKREAPLPATFMGVGTYSCADCSKDLDENGLFPEERLQL